MTRLNIHESKRAGATLSASPVPAIVYEVLRSPGQPVDAAAIASMEPVLARGLNQAPVASVDSLSFGRLEVNAPRDAQEQEAERVADASGASSLSLSPSGPGFDFSRVRVHTDARAAESALSVRARAYTLGEDIVFGAGQFAPSTSEGSRLLSHELVHVTQQARAARPALQRAPLRYAAQSFTISVPSTPFTLADAQSLVDQKKKATPPEQFSLLMQAKVHPADRAGSPVRSGLLQRKCACDGKPATGVCQECGKKSLQRKTWSSPLVAQNDFAAPEVVHEVLRSPGRPLETNTRAFLETRFGHDFGRVRVHSDSQAAESARAVDAHAYTVQQHIVFGHGRYAPDTMAGVRLLAHELAHTVQQARQPVGDSAGGRALPVSRPNDSGEREADCAAERVVGSLQEPSISDVQASPVLQRQAPSGPGAQSTTQPTTVPQAGQGWQGCPPDRVGQLNRELADAVSWVSEAIADLQRSPLPAHTRGALGRYLTTDPGQITGTILPTLRSMLTELQGGPSNFQCRTQAQCVAMNPNAGDAAALASHPISLCDSYFSLLSFLMGGSLVRTSTLIHEVGHHANLGGDTYEFTWPFPGLSVGARLQNADSFAAFVATNHNSWLPPLLGPTGLGVSVGAGALFQQGTAAPRFVATAELSFPLAQRVFHFFDLRLGVRVDVDSAGSIIGSGSLGARVYAPTSVSRVPWYLDLSGGVAGGPSAGANLAGPTGEVRTGILGGHLGASIGYRHIWNLLQTNPDISELTINGELRF